MSIFANEIMKNKVVLVTGGATGIGKGIANLFGQHGAKVMIASRKEQALVSAVNDLKQAAIDADYCVCDIRDPAAVEQLMEVVSARFGGLDILVNNAAGNFPAAIDQLSPNGFKTVVDIDLNGTFNMTKAAFEHFFKSAGGNIVNISAPFAGWGVAYQAHAAAAKAGIDSLTRSCAVEWQARGVRVNAVAPGAVSDTEGLERLSDALVGDAGSTQACQAEDIANSVLFLASDAARFISGEITRVDSATGVDLLKLAPTQGAG
ncbi:MAG TPA: short-chain dehydrogenase [Cellvibrionales bacterium]|nr:short-chain dehydrogenase [Cellvibrionales bacterium]